MSSYLVLITVTFSLLSPPLLQVYLIVIIMELLVSMSSPSCGHTLISGRVSLIVMIKTVQATLTLENYTLVMGGTFSY